MPKKSDGLKRRTLLPCRTRDGFGVFARKHPCEPKAFRSVPATTAMDRFDEAATAGNFGAHGISANALDGHT
jgi:hypothetical protein